MEIFHFSSRKLRAQGGQNVIWKKKINKKEIRHDMAAVRRSLGSLTAQACEGCDTAGLLPPKLGRYWSDASRGQNLSGWFFCPTCPPQHRQGGAEPRVLPADSVPSFFSLDLDHQAGPCDVTGKVTVPSK